MKARMTRLIVPALLAAALPTFALAQAPAPAQPPAKSETRARLSPDALARLQDGRMAMIKETLKLNETQLKLWAPVEAHIRASAAARETARAERRQARQARQQPAQRPALPDRLDRASENLAKRAEQMKAFADVFKPFYTSLGDEQKALAGVVLREARGQFGGRGHGHRWAMRRAPAAPQQ